MQRTALQGRFLRWSGWWWRKAGAKLQP